MKTNEAGRKIIQEFEGLRLESYPDPFSAMAKELRKPIEKRNPNWACLPGDPWTIGIGATGKGIGMGTTWTSEQVWARFESDLAVREKEVARVVIVPINENQFSALVSFLFNFGLPKLHTSTLLRKFNQGDTLGAAEEFPHWIHAGGEEVQRLRERRAAEQLLFLTPILRAVA